MNVQEAKKFLSYVLDVLVRDGYVVNGDVTFCRPVKPGLVQTLCHVDVAESGLVRFELKTARAAVTPLRPLFKPDAATGEVCSQCGGSRFQRTGTCMTCLDCGTAAGGCG